MQTKSHISAAALAAALFAVPQLASGQILGVDLDLDVLGVEADADVDVGGDKLLDVDAGVDLGGDSGVDASVDVGGTDADDSLVDIDLNTSGAVTTGATGPNGGRLIDLDISHDDAALDADIDLLPRDDGTSLVDGTIRIGALDDNRRGQALLDLIDSPNLAELDLDAAIDDRRVSILAAADLLPSDDLARIDAAITAGGEGRDELLAALASSARKASTPKTCSPCRWLTMAPPRSLSWTVSSSPCSAMTLKMTARSIWPISRWPNSARSTSIC